MIKEECAKKCFYEIENSEAGSMEGKTPSRILKCKNSNLEFFFFRLFRILKLLIFII